MSISLKNHEDRITALEGSTFVRLPDWSNCLVFNTSVPTTNTAIGYNGWLRAACVTDNRNGDIYINDVNIVGNYGAPGDYNDNNFIWIPVKSTDLIRGSGNGSKPVYSVYAYLTKYYLVKGFCFFKEVILCQSL